jgi:predicted O-linked N-acetylglucosamine transferase (SPINDLY family)
LAQNASECARLKERLRRVRKSPLFDTVRFTRNIECAYITMWERAQRGEPPAHFALGLAEA